MTLGAPYVFKADNNPCPGQYEPDAGFGNDSLVGYRNRSAIIREATHSYRRPKETTPDPGSYDGHL